MKLSLARRRRQRGAALIALAALLVLGMAWMLISAVGSPGAQTASRVGHNARVLAEAKAALIAYVAREALEMDDPGTAAVEGMNPGRLPCPQAWGDVGTENEGRAAGICSAPAAGWLPWRTLGLPKLTDATGQQLWYIVSPGWHLPSSSATLTINSNTPGQLSVDGAAAVALIVAPGAALNISPNAAQSAAGCSARVQNQALSATPNALDFLECQNGSTSDSIFTAGVVDNATNPVFNDQVLVVTAADVLPALEAAIARRIEKEVAPLLKAAFNTAPAACSSGVPATQTNEWGVNFSCPAGTATNPVFPFAVPFGNPGTSSFQGAAAGYSGLVPFNYSTEADGVTPCVPASNPRCTTTLLAWGTPSLASTSGTGNLWGTPTCDTSAVQSHCEGYYQNGSVAVQYDDAAAGAAKGLRTFNSAGHTVQVWAYNYNTSSWTNTPGTASRTLSSDASLRFRITATLPSVGAGNWGYYHVYAGRPVFYDHALLSTTNATTGWFVRNEWYRLLYYALAPNHAAGGTGSCTDGATPTCLQVANVTPANKQRAMFILAGRSLTGAARPNGTLADFVEGSNADGNQTFEQLAVNPKTFNDRIVVIDANP